MDGQYLSIEKNALKHLELEITEGFDFHLGTENSIPVPSLNCLHIFSLSPILSAEPGFLLFEPVMPSIINFHITGYGIIFG